LPYREEDMPMYMIGIVAKMLSVHPQTLRMYEREGLITPSRSKGRVRLYSRKDVERAKFILYLTRDLGVNLAGVEIILRMKDQIEQMQKDMEGLINYIRKELKKELDEINRQARRMEEVIDAGESKKVKTIKVERIDGGESYADQ